MKDHVQFVNEVDHLSAQWDLAFAGMENEMKADQIEKATKAAQK